MSGGDKAAAETKGFFKNIGDLTEGIRTNINTFADDMIGHGSGTHANTAEGNHNDFKGFGHHNKAADATTPADTTTTSTTAGTTGTTGPATTGSGTIHPDAQKAGEEVKEGVHHFRTTMRG